MSHAAARRKHFMKTEKSNTTGVPIGRPLSKIAWPMAALALALCWALTGCDVRTVPYEAKVLEKIYTPPSTSTGMGYGMTMNGKMGMVMTTSYEGEKYTLIIQRMDSYETRSVLVNAATWAGAEKGAKITLTETLLF